MSAWGVVSRTGKVNRTWPTGVSVAMVHRATPPVSRRMFSTPPSMSVKLVRLAKKPRTACKGAFTFIFPLNDDRTLNISRYSKRVLATWMSLQTSSWYTSDALSAVLSGCNQLRPANASRLHAPRHSIRSMHADGPRHSVDIDLPFLRPLVFHDSFVGCPDTLHARLQLTGQVINRCEIQPPRYVRVRWLFRGRQRG